MLINTGLGLYIESDNVKMSVTDIALKGILYGVTFSFLVFLVIWAMMYFMHKGKRSAGNIFLILLVIEGGIVYCIAGFKNYKEKETLSLHRCRAMATA